MPFTARSLVEWTDSVQILEIFDVATILHLVPINKEIEAMLEFGERITAHNCEEFWRQHIFTFLGDINY